MSQQTPSGRFNSPTAMGQASERQVAITAGLIAKSNAQTMNPNTVTFDSIKSPQPAAQPVAPSEIPASQQFPMPGKLSNGPATPVGTDISVSKASFGNTGTYDDSSPAMKSGWVNPTC